MSGRMPNVRTGIIQGVSKWYMEKSKLCAAGFSRPNLIGILGSRYPRKIELFGYGNENPGEQDVRK